MWPSECALVSRAIELKRGQHAWRLQEEGRGRSILEYFPNRQVNRNAANGWCGMMFTAFCKAWKHSSTIPVRHLFMPFSPLHASQNSVSARKFAALFSPPGQHGNGSMGLAACASNGCDCAGIHQASYAATSMPARPRPREEQLLGMLTFCAREEPHPLVPPCDYVLFFGRRLKSGQSSRSVGFTGALPAGVRSAIAHARLYVIISVTMQSHCISGSIFVPITLRDSEAWPLESLCV